MKSLRNFFKKHVTDPFIDQYYPRAMRFYRNEKTREDRVMHYRYPSPASQAPENSNIIGDYRVGYSDSPHNIRYEFTSVAPEPINQTILSHNLHSSPEEQKTGHLISRSQIPADTIL